MTSVSRLESIYKDLEKEHQRVIKQMDRLRAECRRDRNVVFAR